MKKNSFTAILDLFILIILVYFYLWRIGPINSLQRIILSFQFTALGVIFYAVLIKIFKFNHWAVLLGTITFTFCGSDFTSVFAINKVPYPGMLGILLSVFYFSGQNKKKMTLFLASVMMFVVAFFAIAIELPALMVSCFRLLFNICAGIMVSGGFERILNIDNQEPDRNFSLIKRWLYRAWIFNLIVLMPIAYTALILCIEIDRYIVPSVTSWLVMSEIFLSWVLIIASKKAAVISEIIPLVTIFLVSADIFSFWVVK